MSSRLTVDIAAVIDAAAVSGFQIRTIGLCFLLAMIDGFDTQSIAFVAPAIAEAWQTPFSAFGPVFGIGLLGSTVGTLTLGFAGDRRGRKTVLIPSVVLFGLGSLATVWAASLNELMAFRFITGIGLGGAMPNIIALASEYAPARSRATLVTTMFCGFPLGAVLGGMASAKMIPAFGWDSVFVIGGALALAFVPVALTALPESIRYLALQAGGETKVAAILGRIDPLRANDKIVHYVIADSAHAKTSVKHLFTEGRAAGTSLLWTMFFMTLLLSYFLVNWLPLTLRQAGFPLEKAVLGTVVLNIGGIIGSIVLGRLIDRAGPYIVIWPAFIVGAVFIGAIGFAENAPGLIMLLIFAGGFFAIGAQFSAVALAAAYYITPIRATGIGWSMGVGRVGSMIGPLVGGVLVGEGYGLKELFLLASVTPVIAGLAVFLMPRFGNPAVTQKPKRLTATPQH